MAPFYLCNVFLVVISLYHTVDAQGSRGTHNLKECAKYKFLWSDDDSSIFYYCYNNKNAVQLKCKQGYYMCKKEGVKFQPCDCFDEYYGERNDDVAKDGGRRCVDGYQVYPKTHMFMGNESFVSQMQCQANCNEQGTACIGYDYKTDPSTCWLHGMRSAVYGKHDSPDVTHYKKNGYCKRREEGTTGRPYSNQAFGGGQQILNGHGVGSPEEDDNTVDGATTGPTRSPNGRVNNRGIGGTFATGPVFTGRTTGQQPAVTFTRPVVATTPTIDPTAQFITTMSANSGTTPPTCVKEPIPDTGCPGPFQVFEGLSHPYGINITNDTVGGDIESCKQWCLEHMYCRGVDFDMRSKTCYYLREIQQSLLDSSSSTFHYEKVFCSEPLKCWVSSGEFGTNAGTVSVTNSTLTQEECQGMCYNTLNVLITGQSASVKRGCQPFSAFTEGPMKPACEVSPGLDAITCYCDTNRCNGLSINAMAGLILHLPLDKDFSDHSGMSRDGMVAEGYDPPTFTCLERAINCSAQFTGKQCIDIGALFQTAWGVVNNGAVALPQATFCVWFKRVFDGSTVEEGIFGNARDQTVTPSWHISGHSDEGFIQSGVVSTQTSNLNDYTYIPVDTNWHLACLAYDGRPDDPANQVFSSLTFYLDGVAQNGNSRDDFGDIQIRSQPVTIGCVGGNNFTGFIDDAMIFQGTLKQQDVQALLLMRDSLYI